jgi:serine/threonine protein kinase
MSESPRCPKCGIQLSADVPAGLCPKCLVQAGFESQVASQPTIHRPDSSRFEPPSLEELAAKFPQLEMLELLGKGGMGAVYKARQRSLDRLVALKILPPEIGRDPRFAERFTREARALARLTHNHIVAVYDFGQVDGLYFIMMEYVDGVNLRQTIQAGNLTAAETLAIVPQICEALQFAHDEGIVHRDIKPENILIDKRGRVKIADFGLAKLLGPDGSDHSLTGVNQVMGTLRYMAPEQMQGAREVDHRADIYSLGVVFYELLTRELPLGRFAPPSKKVAIDVRLDEVVLRALEQEPEQRYQHASDVKSELETISHTPPPPSDLGNAPGLVPGVQRHSRYSTDGSKSSAQAVEPMAQGRGRMNSESASCDAAPFNDSWHATRPPSPSYAKLAGIPTAILFGVGGITINYGMAQYGPKVLEEKPVFNLIFLLWATLFWVTTIILHIVYFARRRAALAAASTSPEDLVRATQPSYGMRVGIPMAILFGVYAVVMFTTMTAHSMYGQKDNFQEQPYSSIIVSAASLFWLGVAILNIAFFARRATWRKMADDQGSTSDFGSAFTGSPMTQMRFVVAPTTDIARQAVFHFSSLGYQVVEQQSDVIVFQRRGTLVGLGSNDIRRFPTRLTVRTAPAPNDQLWVSCDWSVLTLGAWVTRRDIRKLEAEGESFKLLFDMDAKTEEAILLPSPNSALPTNESDLTHLLPQLTLTVLSAVVGGLTMAAGVALAAYALMTESPNSGEFWGWMGGAFGCFFGGGGALIGAINSYRQIAGRQDLMTVASTTWLDRVLCGYGLFGAGGIIAAIAWTSLASPARYSIGLLGTIVVFQSGWMSIVRAAARQR